MAHDARKDPFHPSPHREEVGLTSLWIGILGAPLIWMALEMVSSALTASLCKTDTTSIAPQHTDTVWQYLLPINLVAFLLALIAAGVAINNWRKVRHERAGSAHDLLEIGEGRTRFLAMFGLLTSGGFLIALIFSALMLFLVPLCR
ncbi:hypothetical protein [Candidatus Methylomicrobium oryzae]|uniref:hypothetical protein n=1 Tax=Candidatus Methylomicrobium oryzae TaxID=2802053 RepID=UPI001921BBC1|nr:hypothetical protein [Methylomicrobium sp. RS1]MBL1264264.1 hypothetical protein [Methylomicrobium sp. RS1]